NLMTIIFDTYTVPDKGKVDFNISRSFEIKITAKEAQRLVDRWATTELKIERAIGQTLQHIIKLYAEQKEARTRQQSLRDENAELKRQAKAMQYQIDALIAHTDMPLDQKPKPKRGRKT
ncbi:hypothetical protein QUF58_04685, partial [Anaerolineales bacterium HSG24]|nr:hypothetical protein [Anaerolineales bacterium HSG24]